MVNELIFFSSCLATASLTLISLLFGAQGLLAAICVQGLLENIFVVKQIELFGLHVTSADIFAVGLVLALNLMQEFYGSSQSKRAIWCYFLVSIWFLGARTAHVWYTPSIYDCTHSHFVQILENCPRIILASLTTSLLALHLDRYFYAYIRQFFTGQWAWVCNIASTAFSQFFDTLIFTYLALWDSVANPVHIIFVSYIVKLLALTIAGPFAALARPVHNQTLKSNL